MKLTLQEFEKPATGGCFGSSGGPAIKIRVDASPEEVATIEKALRAKVADISLAKYPPNAQGDKIAFKFWLGNFLNHDGEWDVGSAIELRAVQMQIVEKCKQLKSIVDASEGFGGTREIEL